jgi:hypothetical protein
MAEFDHISTWISVNRKLPEFQSWRTFFGDKIDRTVAAVLYVSALMTS